MAAADLGGPRKRSRSEELVDEGEAAKRPYVEQQVQDAPGIPLYPPGLEPPEGWLETPALGHRIAKLGIVMSKVPLGQSFNRFIPPEKQFNPELVVYELAKKNSKIGMVIDLTHSWRYYKVDEWAALGIRHIKIQCRGRGEAPEPEAVNHFCWEVLNFTKTQDAVAMQHQQAGEPFDRPIILVHCTHGYNRSGYMIANYMVRSGESAIDAVKIFAQHRPPGIYKPHYLDRLFEYNHERKTTRFSVPELPPWKEGDADESPAPEASAAFHIPAEGEGLDHEALIGEFVPPDEEDLVRQSVVSLITSLAEAQLPSEPHFPGSQPVSLAASNLALLRRRRYWVTWKADGTRFMLLLCLWGTYLINRAFEVRRLQMRFPTLRHDRQGKPSLGPRHHFTLLDGEMVVDHNLETDRGTRRFLAYDCMVLAGKPLVDRPFLERFRAIQASVIAPRNMEREWMEADWARGPGRQKLPFSYDYAHEPVRVRLKEFWPLFQAGHLLQDMMPELSHESDGLIFQGTDDAYKSGTCPELLKWKFPHLNSVDFLLRVTGTGRELCLLETRRGKQNGAIVPLPGAMIADMDDEAAAALHNTIVECVWSRDEGAWRFLRVRGDKDKPNAFHVYEKVWQSIVDDISEAKVLEVAQEALASDCYAPDRQAQAKRQEAKSGGA